MRKYIVGLNVPPALVASFRGILLGAGSSIITLVISYLTGDTVPKEWAAFVPMIVFALRQAEGLLDQKRAPNQNKMPPLEAVTPVEAAHIVQEVHTQELGGN